MSDELKFDLPPKAAAPQRSVWPMAFAALVIGAGASYFVASPRDEGIAPADRPLRVDESRNAELLTATEYVSLAERLERNQLYAQAAEAWQEASRLEPPADDARTARLFRIGKNLHLAGRYAEALRFLFAAESADAAGKWKQSINPMVLEGLSALGQEDVREYQTLKRAGLAAKGTSTQPDEKALGRIGAEPITELDLRTFARTMVERQLAPQKQFMPAGAFESAVKSALERFRTPEAQQQLLIQYISSELLYREALASGIPDRAEVKKTVVDTRRQVLIGAFVDYYLTQAVQIDEAGIKDAYEANKERYIEPEAIRLEAIVVDDEAAKKKISDALSAGEDFASVREAHSLEKAQPDALPRWTPRDGTLPGVEDSRAAIAHLFALKDGQVGDRWFEGDGRWCRYRIAERRPQRQLTLDECRERVERELRARKQRDALEQLEQSLRAKHKVEVKTQPAGAGQ